MVYIWEERKVQLEIRLLRGFIRSSQSHRRRRNLLLQQKLHLADTRQKAQMRARHISLQHSQAARGRELSARPLSLCGCTYPQPSRKFPTALLL